MEPALLLNQRQVGIGGRRERAFIETDIDACLATGLPRKNCYMPLLQVDIDDENDIGGQNMENVYDRSFVVPGICNDVNAADRDATSVNQQLLQSDRLDIEAVRELLQRPISNNSISVKQYWQILKLLKNVLSTGKLCKVPNAEKYARVLTRLAYKLVIIPDRKDRQPAYHFNILDYEECLNNLISDIGHGLLVMRQNGAEEEVYVTSDTAPYIESLHSLTAHLRDT